MAFKNFGEQLEIPTKEEKAEIEEPKQFEEISKRVEGLQNIPSIGNREKLERNKERIEISHQIIDYLLNADEKKAQELWENLEPSFKEKRKFSEFKNGILAEAAFMRLLNKLKLEEAHPASVELDRKSGIDFIGRENGKMELFQIKGKNVSDLKNSMKETELKPDDLIIPLPVESANAEKFIKKLTKESANKIVQKMRSGGNEIRKEQDYTGEINYFLVVIPSEKGLKANGEFSLEALRDKFVEKLKGLTEIAS